MKTSVHVAVVAAGLMAAAMGSAGLASAAANSPADAAEAIRDLQSEGYRVILNKVGSEPLSQCHVISVRWGHPLTETVPAGGGDTALRVLYTPVYLDVVP